MLGPSKDFFSPAPITDAEYDFICQLVYEHSRIKLGPNKRELVMARLSKRLRSLGQKTYGDYCKFLKTPKGEEELGDLIDAISTNHTFFFRESAHFDFLKNTILPEFAPREAPSPKLHIWSAACSSGEEPYSIALLLAD
ncbi:MAG: chemotaxis protein CheR, partial [Alphaproteobacteria bacterium]|nr:chemotaxis protein CheR [Alphaproteobacteria bacterium]